MKQCFGRYFDCWWQLRAKSSVASLAGSEEDCKLAKMDIKVAQYKIFKEIEMT